MFMSPFDYQTRALTRSFEVLLKDRAIISAEMLHEYDEKVRSSLPPFHPSPRSRPTRLRVY